MIVHVAMVIVQVAVVIVHVACIMDLYSTAFMLSSIRCFSF